ncbi:YraN family protein [Paenibacillus sp. WLX2291]|uniref:YraN family protein n=1 Tax=Paenibacillus sp. WLX2291 TaxID=3296934 RepID=UPI003984396C
MVSSHDRPDDRKRKGNIAEDIAAYYLEQQGYTIVQRNWRCRSGELDIIATELNECTTAPAIIVVEVRSRASDTHGTAAESIDWRKRKQIRETTSVYAHQNGLSGYAFRYDVITVQLNRHYQAIHMEHWIKAFV